MTDTEPTFGERPLTYPILYARSGRGKVHLPGYDPSWDTSDCGLAGGVFEHVGRNHLERRYDEGRMCKICVGKGTVDSYIEWVDYHRNEGWKTPEQHD